VDKPIKIAIAGGGYGRKVALPVYAELEEFEPVAVWSRRPERARELAEADEGTPTRCCCGSVVGGSGW
jgi:predicted dehydrogenase